MNENKHGGKRERSGAHSIEGKEYKVILSGGQLENLNNNYKEIKTIPKKVREAVDDAIKYKTEVIDVKNVAMEIFNDKKGRIQFYIKDENNSDETNMMDVEKFVPCSKITYYKRSNLFEITVLMSDYIDGDTKEAANIINTRHTLEEIRQLVSRYGLTYYSETIKSSRYKVISIPFSEDVYGMSYNFGTKYNEKINEFNSKLFELEAYMANESEDYKFEDWLDKNFDKLFKEQLRERVSKEQLDTHIKYDELMEVIKEDIAMENVKFYFPEEWIDGGKLKDLKVKISYAEDKLKVLERRKPELENLDKSKVNYEYIKNKIEKEVQDIAEKLIDNQSELDNLIRRKKENDKLKTLRINEPLVKFEWNKFLSDNEIEFILNSNEVLEEKTSIINSLKRISKKQESELEIIKSSRPKVSSEVIKKYTNLILTYLEKYYNLKGQNFNKELQIRTLKEGFLRSEFEIYDLNLKKWDKNLELTLDFYSLFPEVSIKEVVELSSLWNQVNRYYIEKITPLINEFNEEISNKESLKNYSENLLISVKERIFKYHKKKCLIPERGFFAETDFIAPCYKFRETDKETSYTRQIKGYTEKLQKFNQLILNNYNELKDERDTKLNGLIAKAQESLNSFNDLKEEVSVIEIKPNNYIVSN